MNAAGDIIDPATGQVVAGVRTADGKGLADARKLLREGALPRASAPRALQNTTIAVVATNARFTKVEVNRIALMADDGLARAINPVAHDRRRRHRVRARDRALGRTKPTQASSARSRPKCSPRRSCAR